MKRKKDGEKTTYNVGVIEGGTSVNTICQKASMLCEYRSTDKDCLEFMKQQFNRVFSKKYQDAEINVELVGDRPCASDFDKNTHNEMINLALKIQSKYCDRQVVVESGSTDCNIPLSLGIPAVCCGAYMGEGEHTREEWIRKDTLLSGYHICYDIIEEESNF